ncbi:hypothetical protein JQ629_32545 [Bradyrhizobium sp. AUGA SZCCT0222]|uniref:hypothetical protein n=1 Tax=Bradyrhizobium sp. AUGA SZCCT0222 TaxID=2807668 RepID=UPI001BA78DA4|nr:hypothetical protein [Bradyrhizobium sp. AUGA SZCCT0222]MBR1272213.1 hypothetical protein [Bradyrhizobium sp. AUGA SZCCT0222]
MFLVLTETPNMSYSPVKRAFGRVESGGTRRNMILSAAEAYFGQHWEDKNVRLSFSRILEAISYASKRRDDIAHGIAEQHIIDGRHTGWFLYPANYNTERTKPWLRASDDDDDLFFTFTDYRFTASDIQEFAKRFRELELAVFKQTGLLPKSAHGVIHFVNAVSDNPGIFGLPPR